MSAERFTPEVDLTQLFERVGELLDEVNANEVMDSIRTAAERAAEALLDVFAVDSEWRRSV